MARYVVKAGESAASLYDRSYGDYEAWVRSVGRLKPGQVINLPDTPLVGQAPRVGPQTVGPTLPTPLTGPGSAYFASEKGLAPPRGVAGVAGVAGIAGAGAGAYAPRGVAGVAGIAGAGRLVPQIMAQAPTPAVVGQQIAGGTQANDWIAGSRAVQTGTVMAQARGLTGSVQQARNVVGPFAGLVQASGRTQTAGGGTIPQSGTMLPNVPQFLPGITPVVRATAGGVDGPAKPAGYIAQSPDVAIQAGTIYAGPTGQVGPNEFVVTDLADVALISRAIPKANIFYSDPNQPGPLRAVSGLAAFVPSLNQYLLGHDLPQSVVDTLVRSGLLEDREELFSLSDEGIGGIGGIGKEPRTQVGFGSGGRGFPSMRDISYGLINWRIG